MWRKGSEIERVIALRLAASQSMQGYSLAQSWVHMSVRVYASPTDGDLDNFITGICDSLMAAHPRTPINEADWDHVAPSAKPSKHIVYKNDALVSKIAAERLEPDDMGKRYEIVLEFE